MNKRAIWVIIGLMTAALIGIACLQMHWIKQAIELKEDEFNVSVLAALNRVSEKLELAEEERDNFEAFSKANDINIDKATWREQFVQRASSSSEGVSLEFSYQEATEVLSTSLPEIPDIAADTCSCANCKKERFERYERQVNFFMENQINSMLTPRSLIHRLELQEVDQFLVQEFTNRGIDIEYDYGVFSNRDKSFVINNGHYLAKDDAPHVVQAGWQNLYNSEYRVDLFPLDLQSPGLLMIHFPTKASIVWGSVWNVLMFSILFTSIILLCFVYTVQVIFQQKKLGEMKTDFINNMTHEFKTPIATISLAADSITSPMISGNADKVRRFADIIKQENKRMNSQVEKVLQMALLDQQDFQLNISEIDLHQVISQAVGNSSLRIESKGGKLSTDLQAGKPVIEGDSTHVTNIIHNLVDNANKYSPDSPDISVHTRNVSNGVEVTVKDKGMGMSKEARKHIFDRFYRVHTGNLHDVKGFGLGLSYVKVMMTAHKGEISVKSELGKGSSFILFFPFHIR